MLFPPQSPDQVGFICAQVVKVSSEQAELVHALFCSLGQIDYFYVLKLVMVFKLRSYTLHLTPRCLIRRWA